MSSSLVDLVEDQFSPDLEGTTGYKPLSGVSDGGHSETMIGIFAEAKAEYEKNQSVFFFFSTHFIQV